MSDRMAGEYIGRTNGRRGKTALRCIFMIDRRGKTAIRRIFMIDRRGKTALRCIFMIDPRRKIWYIKSVMNIVMLISLEIINKNNRDYC